MWFKKFYTQLIFVLCHSKLDLQRHHLEVNGWNMLCSIQLRVPTIALVKNSFYISSDQSALQSNQSLLTQFSRFFLINANTPRFLIIKPTQNHVVSAMQIFSFQLRSLRRLYSSLSLSIRIIYPFGQKEEHGVLSVVICLVLTNRSFAWRPLITAPQI